MWPRGSMPWAALSDDWLTVRANLDLPSPWPALNVSLTSG